MYCPFKMVIFRVFLWIFWGRVFLWSCMLLDLHVLSFVLFVWAPHLVGISLWNISSSIAMTNFWCRNPTMGTPSLTFTNIHENSQLNSYVFFWNWTKCTKQSGIKMISLPETNGSQVRTWRVGNDDLLSFFWGVGTAYELRGSCEKLQVDISPILKKIRAGGQTWPRTIAVGEFAD